VAAAAASRPLWRPGSTPPAHLNGSLPGDYGFDPLNLGADPDALRWYTQAELQNGRWAMLGAAGILGENLLGSAGLGGPAAKVPWYEAGAYTYFAPASSLFIAQLFLFGWVEARRYQDYRKPGSASQDPIFTGNALPAGEVGYPGGIFDPLGYAKGGNLNELKLKELKNARLAMLGCAGFFAQAVTTGKQPLTNLKDHLSDPWAINVLSVEHARAL
jgi:light-harvesting complex I chlorophyll a/b binding protein 2/light-harvesting complex I chlorophyll a/b binding protein 4